ncbi:MAG: hypothetical protein JWL90_306 [Chthoniobacteraceae bacterium]|nr:hypothetical protein [Chthoniobacteraceae bacterium]
MIRSPLRPPLASSILVLASLPFASLWALNDKNAGPEAFELRFKLPPPAVLTPEEELATFKIAPGFHAELVAAEPMVDTPISIAWDEKGRMFVCEMRSYMHDVEGAGEDQPLGRIVMLEDTDGDGKPDKRTVFADNLFLPRAIMCVNGGLLVGEPPALWFMKDTDGDGIADLKETADDAYGTRAGQPEHMSNSPTWMLDNWIYSANHAKRYRLRNGKFISEATSSRGQWGMTQDDFGRPFYNFNSDFLRANLVPESLAKRNPNYPADAGLGVQVLKDQSCWPSHPTPGVNRGYEPKQLREDGTLASCTATCGAGIYRGSLFAPEFAGNAFIPEPSGNLVKRVRIDEQDAVLSAGNVYQQSEFWTSTDERFRPVNAYSGPDGALYVADMYRGVIQHKGFLTHYLVANIKDRKLETPFAQGRIWRIVPDGAKPHAVKLPAESDKLVAMLGDANGWTRDTAQRLLVERKDLAVAAALNKLAQESPTPLAVIHALWTLEGIEALTPEVLSTAFKNPDAKVRATAIRLAGRLQTPEVAKLVNDPSVDVRIALGFHLSAFPEGHDAVIALARLSGGEPLVRDAILSGLRGRELETLQALVAGAPAPGGILEALSLAVMNERRTERVKKLFELINAQPANSPVQIALLTGASGKSSVIKGAPKAKLLYLDAASSELTSLAASADAKVKPLVAALDGRVAWPNKPGVPPPPVIKPLTKEEQNLFEIGKGVYDTLCTACHQPTGAGMEGLAPALVDSEWVLGKPDVLPRILIHGLTGPIKVGTQTWSLEMPPLGAALNDEQIAGVLTYIRRQWEHGASPIKTETVAGIRADNQARTKAWTAEELLGVPNVKPTPKP